MNNAVPRLPFSARSVFLTALLFALGFRTAKMNSVPDGLALRPRFQNGE
jgi:hypothetical protein